MKATEQYFPVVLFIVLYKVVLTFASVDEILECDHSNEAIDHYFLVAIFDFQLSKFVIDRDINFLISTGLLNFDY